MTTDETYFNETSIEQIVREKINTLLRDGMFYVKGDAKISLDGYWRFNTVDPAKVSQTERIRSLEAVEYRRGLDVTRTSLVGGRCRP